MSSTYLSAARVRPDVTGFVLSLRQKLDRCRPATVLLLLLASCSAFLDIAESWIRYRMFYSAGVDLGIFDQAVRHYAHFDAPVAAIKGPGFNVLGDHFSPLDATLAPLYWIWADPRMLGIAMAILLSISVFPVYTFTVRHLGSEQAGLLASAGYLLWWPLQALVAFDFHEIAIGVPVMAWLIDALDRRRYGPVALACILLCGVREDLSIVAVMVAVILLVRGRRQLAAAFASAGLLTYLVTTALLIPALSATGRWSYWDYPALGPNAPSAVLHVLTHPIATVRMLTDDHVKRWTLDCLFAPPQLLAVGSPYLLLGLPVLLSRLLSGRSPLWTTFYQYNAILAPIIVLAAVDCCSRALRWWPALQRDRSPVRRRPAMLFAVALMLVSVCGMATDRSLYPLHNVLVGDYRSSNAHTSAQGWAVGQVPAGVCVEADDRLIPHLVRHDVVTLPSVRDGRASWLLLDMGVTNTGGGNAPTPRDAYAQALSQGFRLITSAHDLRVMTRSVPVAPSCRHIG